MRYVSLFSGIEAATVAWEPLGWEPVAFSEVDPFCCEVLKHRFPEVPNLGDVTKIDWSGYVGAVDLVVGGSPCQSFSVAGRREGLAGESGLMYEYIRAVRELRPAYFVWENVPGAFSSEEGRLSDSSSMKWMNSGTVWRGVYSTRNSSEWPSDAAACSLSACLETGPHLLRYCLSPRALSGIFRRAKSRGRSLPMPLGAAMAAQTVWMRDA